MPGTPITCLGMMVSLNHSSKLFDLNYIIVTLDREEQFHSSDHVFLTNTLENFSFGKNFVSWIKILLKIQSLAL